MKITDVHPFERAGLGYAPFRCTGMEERAIAHPGGISQPSGTCQYCGTGIRYCFKIRSSDGKSFVVGSDCVYKTDAAFNSTLAKEVRALQAEQERAKREVKRVALMNRTIARCRGAAELLEQRPELFAAEPHPSEYWAKQGNTLRDYYLWMLKHGGQSGKTHTCKIIEAAVSTVAA